jgi:hypothetical protein
MDEYGSHMDAADLPGQAFTIRGCVIRFEPGTVNGNGTFTSGGPYIHANTAHIAVGVTGVSVQNDGDLEVTTDGMSPVVSCAVSPDETLSSRGIMGGASVGTSTILRFYKSGVGRLYLNQQTHWDYIAGTLANVWVLWVSMKNRGT